MTLMPVSNSSRLRREVSNAGGARWIAQRSRGVGDGVALVDRLAEHVEDAAERHVADGHR